MRENGEPPRYIDFDLQGPLTIQRYQQDLRSIQCENTGVESSLFSTYSLRRVLPTIANIMRSSDTEKDAIGDWRDSGKAQPMAVQYADDRVNTAAAAKWKHPAMVVEAVKVCQSAVSWTEFKAITRRDDFTPNEPLVHDLEVATVPEEAP